MNCSEVQESLSSYHDGELSSSLAAEVADHLANCSSCFAELASFSELSDISRRLTNPPVPAEVRDELEEKLREERKRTAVLGRTVSSRVSGKFVAIAATIFIAAGLGVVAYQAWFAGVEHDHLHNHLAENFGSFLDEFENRPDKAQQILLVNYEGRPTTLREAADVLGYEPVVAKGLPAGCSLEKVYLLKMPCCTCAQVVCRNEKGHSIAIFEHDSDQPMWFGSRPTAERLCHDISTSVVQVGNRFAATWQDGKRFLTIIGAADLDEVTDFVGYYSGARPNKG